MSLETTQERQVPTPLPKFKRGLTTQRVLGEIRGDTPGPTLVVLTGMHGNEEGGVIAAMRMLSRMERLDLRPRGRVLVLACNLPALAAQVRYVDHDLNRMWQASAPHSDEVSEYADYLQLSRYFEALGLECLEPIQFIDLHSFSGKGQPFLIAPEQGCRDSLVMHVPFPVIKGLNKFVKGTCCSFLESQGHFTLALEGGQDADPAVPVNMEAFLWQVMARLGLMDSAFVPKPALRTWDELFEEERTLPRVLRAVHRHRILPGDQFVMKPGFSTFDRVRRGDLLAQDQNGEIHAPMTGWLLMPLYQGQGEDGFFIAIEEE